MSDAVKQAILNLLVFVIVVVLIWCTKVDLYSYILGITYTLSLVCIGIYFQNKRIAKERAERLAHLLNMLDSVNELREGEKYDKRRNKKTND